MAFTVVCASLFSLVAFSSTISSAFSAVPSFVAALSSVAAVLSVAFSMVVATTSVSTFAISLSTAVFSSGVFPTVSAVSPCSTTVAATICPIVAVCVSSRTDCCCFDLGCSVSDGTTVTLMPFSRSQNLDT